MVTNGDVVGQKDNFRGGMQGRFFVFPSASNRPRQLFSLSVQGRRLFGWFCATRGVVFATRGGGSAPLFLFRVCPAEKDGLTRDLLDYLARVGMPAGVHHPDSEVGREVMASCPEDEGRWPIVSSLAGWCGHCPDVRSLANQLYGRPDEIDVDEVVDLVVVARVGGTGCRVYASRGPGPSAWRPRRSAARPAPAR